MNSRRIDHVMILIGALLIAVSSYQLLWGHRIDSENLNILGELSSLSSVVKTKNVQSLEWRDATVGNSLADNQLIYTDSDSSAGVTFLSGDGLEIGASSLVRLHSRNDTNIMDVQKGQIRTSLNSDKPMTVEFNGKDYLLTGKGAEVQINLSGDKGEIGVIKGEVRLQSGDEKLVLDEKNAVQITGETITPTQIYFQIQHPVNGDEIYIAESELPVSFGWSPVEVGDVQIASNPEFNNAETINSEILKTRLFKPGQYFWKLKSEKGISLMSSFRIFQEVPIIVLRPKHLEEVTILSSKTSSDLVLQWKGEPQAKYEVEWSQGELKTELVTGTSTVLHLKDERDLKWRARISSARRPNALWSEWQEIKLKIIPFPILPENLFPHEVEFQSYKGVGEEIEMNWRVNGTVEWELTYPDNTKGIQVLSESFTKITAQKSGLYQWRVRSVDSYNRTSDWTETKTFILQDLSKEKNAEGIQRIQLKKPDQEVAFTWNSPEGSTDTFELARDQKFNDVVIKKDLTTKSTKVIIPKVGTYFWRSRQITADGKINVSEPIRVIIEPAPGPVKPNKLPDMEVPLKWKTVQPKTTWMNSILDFIIPIAHADDLQSSVTLTLPHNDEARGFVMKIYKDMNLQELVLEKRIYTTEFEWEQATPGVFYWQYAVIDHWDRVSPFSDPSRLVVKGSETPPLTIEQPKLLSPIRAVEIELKDLELNWSLAGEKASYKIQVSHDETFKETLTTQTTTKLNVKPEIQPSTEMFYWRVKATIEDQSIVSNTGRFFLKPPLERIIISDQQVARPVKKEFKSRAMALWAPSSDSYSFSKNAQNGKIDGNVLNGIELKGTLIKSRYILNAEVIRQSGVVFKKEDYLFQRLLVDGAWIFSEKEHHRFAVGLAVGQTTGQYYSISNSVVTSSSASGLNYGPTLRGQHQISQNWEIQSRLQYLSGDIKQIDINAEALRPWKNLLFIVGGGLSKRTYKLNEGEQTSLKISVGLGKEF